jgi:2-oxoglutarate dehydrogenase E1 component
LASQGSIVATGAIRRYAGTALMTVSNTYDHRIIQGAESGAFLATIEKLLGGGENFYEYIAAECGLRPEALASSRAMSPEPARVTDQDTGLALNELVRSYREHGHRAAHFDPLAPVLAAVPELDPAYHGLNANSVIRLGALAGETVGSLGARLRQAYCGTAAFEVEHLPEGPARDWLRAQIEAGSYRVPLDIEGSRALLERLTQVEALEHFLGRAYLGQTRFSIEGLDVLVPMLETAIECAGVAGVRRIEIGMAHRGRINVLAHVVGMSYRQIIAEFAAGGPPGEAPEGETSDVKYHMGADLVRATASGPVAIRLSPNPSHLEAIDPVVEGQARAAQTDRTANRRAIDPHAALAILVHGDASFAAQGVVAETFNLARLAGYRTGGTIHIIANNSIGFTVEPSDGRSTPYASDLAKGFGTPIAHVNADDPPACLDVIRLALAYRERFGEDFLVDLVGYRRLGHNEGDEPAYTQPLMYRAVGEHPSVREIYRTALGSDGPSAQESETALRAAQEKLSAIREQLDHPIESEQIPALLRQEIEYPPAMEEWPLDWSSKSITTSLVGVAQLCEINEALLAVPEGFNIHPKLVPQFARRRAALEQDGQIGWAQAEALALGSLLADGVPVRLTGQDTVRGTFSQRHLTLHDAVSGAVWTPMAHLPRSRAALELYDSPLSEFACLGFEYGYAVAAPEALVIWEAQYGDFAYEAQVIIDGFLSAGAAKWGRRSRLTLLLPHGYEGQGPDHSSGRLERFLALGAECNLRVTNPTTPAQYFRLLRDQGLRSEPLPLVVMSPKGLLRSPAATSRPSDLADGYFEPVLDDEARSADPDAVHRLVLCSGRLYYDLVGHPESAVAVVRVEQLYPFPAETLAAVIAGYRNLETLVWAQEEPYNMGARKFVRPELAAIAPGGVASLEVSRPERSSPAEGRMEAHRAAQARIVAQAMGKV